MATESYKFLGSTDPSQPVERIMLDGSVINPGTTIEKGDVVELSEEEVESYKASGLKFRKASDSDVEKAQSESDGEQSPLEARKAQAEAQVASGAQGPAATLSSDNTPGGRAAKGK